MFGLLARYALLIILPLSGLAFYYEIFTPLTVYPTVWIMQLWYDNAVLLGEETIFYNGNYAQIANACIAGAAYYLLTILNFTTPMHLKKRIKSLLFLMGSFLLLNIIRIVVFAKMYDSGLNNYFDAAHQLTWYFGSTLLIVAVWFSNILLFNIRAIPIYTDVMEIVTATEFFPSLTSKLAQKRASNNS